MLCPGLFLPIYFLFIGGDISFLEKERKRGREKETARGWKEGGEERKGKESWRKRGRERKKPRKGEKEGGKEGGGWKGEREKLGGGRKKGKVRFNQLQK